MGLFKSAEERAEARARRAEERFARSPVGRATSARDRGDALLQIELPVDEHSATVLSEIEAIGWRLEHAGYTSTISSYSGTNSNDALSYINITSELTGVYLFRRP